MDNASTQQAGTQIQRKFIIRSVSIVFGKIKEEFHHSAKGALRPGTGLIQLANFQEVPIEPEMVRVINKLADYGVRIDYLQNLLPSRLLRERFYESKRIAQFSQMYVPKPFVTWGISQFLQTFLKANLYHIVKIVPRCRTLIPDIKRYFNPTTKTKEKGTSGQQRFLRMDVRFLFILFEEPFFQHALPKSFSFKISAEGNETPIKRKFKYITECKNDHGIGGARDTNSVFLAIYEHAR